MTTDEQQKELAAIVAQFSEDDGSTETAIPAVRCLKFSVPNAKIPDIYDPSLCVIVQGSKRVLLEDEIYHYSPSEFLAVSVDLPLIGQVIDASAEKPYLCLQILIDQRQLSDLITPLATEMENKTPRGIFVGKVNEVTLDAVLRLARLLTAPEDISALAPVFLREIHYRMIKGEYGPSIAQLALPGSNVNQIAKVIERLRSDVTQPIRVKELADFANMSVSSLHYHFRAVTAMSPLQYFKRLRLTEARQIMLSEGTDAASAAYRVGYESPSQFSREYARLFGAPPGKDIATIKGVRHSG